MANADMRQWRLDVSGPWLAGLLVIGGCSDEPPIGGMDTSHEWSGTTPTTISADSTGVEAICEDGISAPGEVCFPYSMRISDEPTPALALGDFNGDGVLDIVAGHEETMTIHLGLGDGTFEERVGYPLTTAETRAITVGDFDGDLDLDVAVARRTSVGIHLGNGDGTFGPEAELPLALWSVLSIIAADFDGDGDLDLVATSPLEGAVGILDGRGDGSFGSEEVLGSFDSPLCLVAADFDGASPIDLAVSSDDGIGVFLGSPTGPVLADVPMFTGSAEIVARDFDGDGATDLAYINTFNGVRVSRGTGTGAFHETMSAYAVLYDDASSMAVGDFDSDGHGDLVVSYYERDSIHVLLSSVSDPVEFQRSEPLDTVGYPTATAVGDVDGDGDDDIVVGGSYAPFVGGIRLHLNAP